jgi:hypothetical protein
VSFGFWRAVLVDVVAAIAYSLGLIKRAVQGKRGTSVPHFVRDLIRHSVIWPKNRRIPGLSTGAPLPRAARSAP